MSKTKDSIAAPPVAARRPFAVTTHGDTRVDDYVWLRDRDNPSAIAYLEEENRYLNESLSDISDLRAQLYQEILGCIKCPGSRSPRRLFSIT